VTRVAAYGVCIDDDRVLLCRLSAVTARPGAWTLPGGGIDFGEHPEAAVVRELAEETGLRGRVRALLAVTSWAGALPGDDSVPYHAIRIVYRLDVEPGQLRHEVGGSTDRAEWFDARAIGELHMVPYAREAVQAALEERPR
jgi:ADP-ribose pyrophosphatase YjhB (NUDIX family)